MWFWINVIIALVAVGMLVWIKVDPSFNKSEAYGVFLPIALFCILAVVDLISWACYGIWG